jgi:hypothetical protein
MTTQTQIQSSALRLKAYICPKVKLALCKPRFCIVKTGESARLLPVTKVITSQEFQMES